MAWEDAALWMDEVRSQHQYDYMKPWHYVNIEKDKTYVRTDKSNVIECILKGIAILDKKQNPSKTEFELKVLFHLVGDIHQPLHCGYADDKGGNNTEVKFLNRDINLHKVWDSEIIEYTKITLMDCIKLMNAMTVDEKQKAKVLDVEVWANESQQLLPEVYPTNNKIDQNYIDRSKLVIEKQLVKAGIRLEMVLDQLFK